MPYKLKNPRPCPHYYEEYTYAETVKVINGVAVVNKKPTRDFLLKMGYVSAADDLQEEAMKENLQSGNEETKYLQKEGPSEESTESQRKPRRRRNRT